MMEQILEEIVQKALTEIGAPTDVAIKFEVPQNTSHGDISTNVAMALAKPMRKAPRELAMQLADSMRRESTFIDAIEVAGPGFINIRFSTSYLTDQLRRIIASGKSYGRVEDNAQKAINLEWKKRQLAVRSLLPRTSPIRSMFFSTSSAARIFFTPTHSFHRRTLTHGWPRAARPVAGFG